MSDIFHDLVDAGEHAVDAAENYVSAQGNALVGIGQGAEVVGDKVVAAGAEFFSQDAVRDDFHQRAEENKDASMTSFEQAGQNLSDAASDFYTP